MGMVQGMVSEYNELGNNHKMIGEAYLSAAAELQDLLDSIRGINDGMLNAQTTDLIPATAEMQTLVDTLSMTNIDPLY